MPQYRLNSGAGTTPLRRFSRPTIRYPLDESIGCLDDSGSPSSSLLWLVDDPSLRSTSIPPLRISSTFSSSGMDLSPEQMAVDNDLPHTSSLLNFPVAPRMKCIPLPPIVPTSPVLPTDDVESRSFHSFTPFPPIDMDTDDSSCPSSSLLPAINNDDCKPSKLVVNWDVSLRDLHCILSTLDQTLLDLTIAPPAGIRPDISFVPEKINLPYLRSLKVEGVDYASLRSLLSSVQMDKLRVLELHVDSTKDIMHMPHQLDIRWRRLTDVTLYGDFSDEALDKSLGSLRDITRFIWSGKLTRNGHSNRPFALSSLRTISICSNDDGCNFFARKFQSRSLPGLQLSYAALSLPSRSRGAWAY